MFGRFYELKCRQKSNEANNPQGDFRREIIEAMNKHEREMLSASLAKDHPELYDAKDNVTAGPPIAFCSNRRRQRRCRTLALPRRATVNAKTDNGVTPLHDAAGNGQKDLVELLLTKGADINAKAKNGGTPLYLATGRDKKSHRRIFAG